MSSELTSPLRIPGGAELAAAGYLAQFRETLYLIGLPRSLTARFNGWPVVAVTFEVRDVFLQTPGPGAGKRLEQA